MRSCWLLLLCVPALRADQAADEALLRGARIKPDGPGLVEFFRSRVSRSDTDTQKIEALVEKLSSGRFKEREKATADLIAIGAPARPALERAAKGADADLRKRAEECLAAIDAAGSTDVAHAALRLLRVHKPDGATAALLAYLPAVRDEGIEEDTFATLAALALRDGKGDVTLEAGLRESAVAHRGAAAMLLGFGGSAAQKESVRQMLKKESEPLVRLRAAQGLLAGKDKSAVGILLPLLSDAPLPVAQQARDTLMSLASEGMPAVDLAEQKEARQKCRDAWERWWDAQQAKIDLAKREMEPPWQNGSGLARRTVMRWVNALQKGDAEEVKKTMDAPFAIADYLVIQTKQELDQLFAQALKQPEAKKFEFSPPRILDTKQFLDKLPQTDMKKFLARLPPGELKIVHLVGKEQGGREETAYLFVRLRKGQGHLIGIAQDERVKK